MTEMEIIKLNIRGVFNGGQMGYLSLAAKFKNIL
jgi:hypothetical protein